jgi:CRP-like cAMP-binding protein
MQRNHRPRVVPAMADLMLDEIDRVDQAFAGNRLLSTFSPEARALIEPHGEVVTLVADEIVLTRGGQVQASLFPFGPTMVSLVVDMADGRSVEVASIGREGAVGGIVSCGHAPAFSRATALVGGAALKVSMEVLEEAKRRSPFIANLFCRFSDYLLAQVMQSGACNAFHSIPARAARWLLTVQDRAGDRIELTQEALAGLLGVQRTSVNAVVRSLQDEGLIAIGRGTVRVTDRAGLERRACECYDIIEQHFGAVIGLTGSGPAAR